MYSTKWKTIEKITEDPKFEGAEEVFKSLFSLEDGADYQALTLAISGDRVSTTIQLF